MPMTHIVNMHDAKSQLSQLIVKAHNGDDIIIARSGKPVAKLVPYSLPEPATRFGAMAGEISGISEEEWAESDRAVAGLWKKGGHTGVFCSTPTFCFGFLPVHPR